MSARGAAATRHEHVLLAAIHHRWLAQAPKLSAAVPAHGAPGQMVMLRGEGLQGPGLEARFGEHTSSALSLSATTALTMVPLSASGSSPISVSRQGLRSNSLAWGGPPGDVPARVLRIDPEDGACGVFRDAPIVLTLSHPALRTSVGPETITVSDGVRSLPGQVVSSPDGRVLVWQGDWLFTPSRAHVVRANGIRDLRGRDVASHESRFTPCDLTWSDFAG